MILTDLASLANTIFIPKIKDLYSAWLLEQSADNSQVNFLVHSFWLVTTSSTLAVDCVFYPSNDMIHNLIPM